MPEDAKNEIDSNKYSIVKKGSNPHEILVVCVRNLLPLVVYYCPYFKKEKKVKLIIH